ncbi:MAG: right-handed parallel beta-helix repeat-containing protein [Victivallaceae bacterium]|nr:right-handed parallel beta-helix repeat-containing protein [Victivallaceae bacterium]
MIRFGKLAIMVSMSLLMGTITLSAGDKIDALKSPSAVSTFESIGITCSFTGDDNKNGVCNVEYRIKGKDAWEKGFPLWRDDKRQEFRGSLVQLTPATLYEIKLATKDPDGGAQSKTFTAKTWSEKFPIAKTITISGKALSKGYKITESGNADGYILYQTAPGTSIDVANKADNCLEVAAHHIIIRGMTLKGAKKHAILIKSGHDIVIEKCDISNWGTALKDGWGINMQCAVYSQYRPLTRVIIQRNIIHNPRSNSNNWAEPRVGYNNNSKHPAGPQAVGFWDSAGNHVIRYNHVYSDPAHYYNDIFGCGANFSLKGFPNANSDIYGNILENCWDDAIETEGANNNVRVWGNYIKNAYKGISSRVTSIGPLYIWRNIVVIGEKSPGDQSSAAFYKSGGTRDKWDNGVFVMHNTALLPKGKSVAGSGTRGIEGAMHNIFSANNILYVEKALIAEIRTVERNRFINDLRFGRTWGLQFALEDKSFQGIPLFTSDFGFNAKTGHGIFYQMPTSPGFNAGISLPNFNSTVPDGKPDIGVHEAGTPAMQFGPKAYLNALFRSESPLYISPRQRPGRLTSSHTKKALKE